MAIDLSRLLLLRGLQKLAGLGLSTSLALAIGCDSTQQVPGAEVPQSKLGGSIKGSFLVSGVEPVAVAPGDLAAVEGFGLTEDAQVLVGDQPVAIVERQSDRTLTFEMPEGNPGMEVVTVRKGAEQSAHLIIRLSTDGKPLLIGGNLKEFCRGERFFTLSGDAVEGERDCLKEVAVCSKEAETGCLASNDFPVVDRDTLASRVVSGESVAGVAGEGDLALPPCQKDGAVDCIANDGFPAADKRQAVAASIAAGVTIAGVSGVLALPPRCMEEGGTDCIVGQGYAAASLAGLADKVLSTASVAGIAGNVTLPPVAEVRAGVAYGVAGAASIGLLTLPPPDDVFAGIQYGTGGNGSTGKLTLAAAANVRVSQGAFGRGGNSVTPALADCAAEGEQSCVANAAYAAADVSGLAAKVVVGATVAGVSGSVHVPAPGTVLAGVSVGLSGSGTVALPPPSQVHLAVSYGADGALTGTLDPGAVPVDCSSDGQTSCTAVASFPAADLTDLASKVLSTASVAGVAGNVTLPATGDVLAAAAYGVGGNGLVGTLTLPQANKVLAGSGSYGNPGAPIAPSYSPDFPASGNVLASDTVDGAPGTLTLPPAASVLASVGPYGVGGSGSTPSLSLPATGKVLASTPYGVGGNGSTGALTLPAASNVLTGSGTYGDPAAAMTPSYSPDFPAAGNVLTGDTVNGVAGTLTLPASGKVLASIQYGAGGNGSTGSLTLPAASAVRIGSGTYGDPGAPMTPSYGPDFPAVANVLSSDTVDGVTGTLTLPATGDVYSGVLYGAGGYGSTGALTLPAATNVRTAQGAFGRSGSSVTPTLADCAADGAQSCVANPAYAAAEISGLAAKVVFGTTVAGVSGSVHVPTTSSVLDGVSVGMNDTGTVVLPAPGDVRLAVSFGASSALTGALDPGAGLPGNCSSDGQTNCIAVTSFPAVDKTNLASKVLSTASVAGVTGNVTLPATGKVLAATAYGVGGSGLAGTLTLPQANKVLAGSGSYGDPGAPVAPSYSPDFPASGNVLASDTVDGAPGTLTLPPATSVLASIGPYGVAGNGSTPSLTLPATGSVLISTQYGVGGNGSTGTLTLPTASNVLTGTGTYGDPAAAMTPSYSPDFPAASNVLSDDTVNGVAGTLSLPAAGKVLASTHYGAGGNGSTGSLTLPAASAVRTGSGTFGDPGAPVTPSYSPDFPAVANVLSSDTVDGAAGTLTLPVAGDVYSGILYGAGGNGATGALTLPSAANVWTSQGAFGRSGNSIWPTLADCATDGATVCVANTSFKAASMAAALIGNIKSGVTIAGVAGGYPSASYPLTGAGATADLVSLASTTAAGSYEWWASNGSRYTGTISDAGTITPSATTTAYTASVYRQFTVAGDTDLTPDKIKAGVNLFGIAGAYPSLTYPLTGADATTDLDLATFDARIKSPASFEWFDSSGARYVNSGDPDIIASNIATEVSIFGTSGTHAPPCTADGETDCLATNVYPAVDTTSLTGWDIRRGKQAGGIAGLLDFQKSMASTSRYDRTASPSVTGLDIYDTIDDYNNNSSFPTQSPSVWGQSINATWLRDSISDNGAGGAIEGDGVCGGTEDCVVLDRMTGLFWSKDDGSSRSWDNAISNCDGKTYGGYTDWRLPTQKEAMQAYIDGIWSLRTPMNLVANTYYWTSTTSSENTSSAQFIYINRAYQANNSKSSIYRSICVRP